MANHWAAHNRHVTLVTLSDTSRDHYSLNHGVRRVALDVESPSRGVLSALVNNVRRVRMLRQAIIAAGAPDVISFGDRVNVLTLLATVGTRKRVIVSERIDPRRHRIGHAWTVLRRLTYRRADKLVVQTAELRRWASLMVGKRRVCVIENSVRVMDAVPWEVADQGSSRTVLSVGRLERQKGFDILLRAFAQVAPHFANWDLVILGEGSQRDVLGKLARLLAIDDRLSMPGITSDIDRVMAESNLFVLPSRYEGFPNALLEAMSLGMAVIGSTASGISQIIRHDLDGLLVPVDDVVALASAMSSLMADSGERARLGQAARTVRERFHIDGVMAKWDALIDTTA